MNRLRRFLCCHALNPDCTDAPPSYALGCCPANWYCPICGFGAATHPHEHCPGWDGETTSLVDRILSDFRLYRLTLEGQWEIASGQSVRVGDMKREQEDA